MSNLEKELIRLQKKLRGESKEKYDRVNPFVEDVTDWKERGEYLFGKNKNITVYNSCTIAGKVKVGENTWIGPYTALDGGKAGIKIGSNCSISSGVNIIGHDSVKWALSGGKQKYEYASVSIGNNCFIGTNAIITKGVSIGNHCLVGANAVVTKNFPNNSIILGIPARIAGRVLIDNDCVHLDYNNHTNNI